MTNERKNKPTRTKKEEKKLLADMRSGNLRCYFCDMPIDEDRSTCSTEYGIFWACGSCWPKWGNPDDDVLEEMMRKKKHYERF